MKYASHKSETEIGKLFRLGRKLSYKKGEIIQHANETPKGVYFLAEGFVKEYTLSKNGIQHFNIMYQAGEVFSIMWAFLDVHQNVFREAYTDITVYVLPPNKLQDALQTNSDLQTEFMYLQMEQMYLLKSRVENLTFSNAYDKVAYCLLYFIGRYGEPHADGWYLTIPFRHQHIADSLSMTRETASRMIGRMEKRGLIRQKGRGHFIVKDPIALANTIGVEDVLGMWPFLEQPLPTDSK